MSDDPSGTGPTEQLARDLDATRRVSPPGPDMPTITGGPPARAVAEGAPSCIGPYEVRAELGRGGMGGAWSRIEVSCRPALRDGVQGKHVSDDLGFRIIARRKK